MDKLKSIFRRKSKAEPTTSATAGTKTDSPNQVGTPTQVPGPSKTETAAAPSSSQPVAPAGNAPVNPEPSVDPPAPAPAPAPAQPADPVAPGTTATNPQKDEAAAVAAK